MRSKRGFRMTKNIRFPIFALAALCMAVPASAQDNGETGEKRTRIMLGPQLSPAWPGADTYRVGPYMDFTRTRERQFEFEAPDQSFGPPLIHSSNFAIGPAFGVVRKRSAADIGADLPKVGFSIEAGAFAQVYVTPELRVRVDGRKGITGHKGWIGEISADYIARQGDDWQFSIGPRVTLGDAKYMRAYFGVTPAAAVTSGLSAYNPRSGVQSLGVTASYHRMLNKNWGIAVFGRYDRLVGDAADSPVVRQLGSRTQPSGGVGLTYTF